MSQQKNTTQNEFEFFKFDAKGVFIEGTLTGFVKTAKGAALVIDNKKLIGFTDGLKKCINKAMKVGRFDVGMNVAIILEDIIETSSNNSFYNFKLMTQKKGEKNKTEFTSDGFEPIEMKDIKAFL